MKTAREIIIDALMETHYDASENTRATNIANRLAAEGFSIVETGRDPLTDGELIGRANRIATSHERDGERRTAAVIRELMAENRALRSTREGKTEPAVDSGDIGHG